MLKVAITGCGLIAKKNHIPSFLRLKKDVEIVSVCDVNEAAAKKVKGNFNVKNYYTDFSLMLSRERPDIVDICTPPGTHAKLAIEALEGGSHVLLEKPMALTVADCDAMIDWGRRRGKEICVLHNQLFNPAFRRARDLLSKGKIGNFLGLRIFLSTPTDYITSKKEHWAHKLPGGVLSETGPHAIYMALAFLENVYNVEVYPRKFLREYPWSSAEDFRINLLAENGAASITLIYGSNQWGANVDIMGTKGFLKIDLEARSVVKYNRPGLSAFSVGSSSFSMASGTLKALVSNGLRHVAGKNYNAHAIGIREFVKSVMKGRPAPVSAIEARTTVRIMRTVIEKLNDCQTKKVIS